jgi:hypothetical protein
VFDYNEECLKQAFDKTKDRSTDRTLSLKTLIRQAKSAFPGIKEEDIIKAFAFSKMSIIDEMENASTHIRMSLTEYYEFICRLTLYIGDSATPFMEKLKVVLDKWLGLYNLLRVEVQFPESDDSDWVE